MGLLESSGGFALLYSDTREFKSDSRLTEEFTNEGCGIFGFVTRGSVKVTLEAGNQRRSGKAAYGEVFVIPPDCRCVMQSGDKQSCHALMIRFHYTDGARAERSGAPWPFGRPEALRFHRFRMPRVRHWAQDLLKGGCREETPQYYLVHSYLYAIAAEYTAYLAKPKEKDGDLADYVLQVKQDMLEHCDAPMDIEELVRLSGSSPAQFYRTFKQHTGQSPLQFMTMAKLNESLRLLANTALSVAEAAHGVGFPDPLYFSRLFKKHMGISPTEYAACAKLRVANLCPVFRGDLSALGVTPVLELQREWYSDPDKDKYVKQVEYCRPELILTAPVSDDLYDTLSQLCPVVMIRWKGYPWRDRLREIGGHLRMPTVAERWLAYFETKLEYARFHIRRHLGDEPYLVVSAFEPFFRVYGMQRIKISDLFYGELRVTPPAAAHRISFLDVPTLEEAAALDCDNVLLLAPGALSDDDCSRLEEEWLRLKRNRPRKRCLIIRHEDPLLYNALFYDRLIDQFVTSLQMYQD